MPTCYKCGEEITFRYVDGICTPIHLTGGCGDSFGMYSFDNVNNDLYQQYSVQNNVFISNHANENFCRHTRCPICGVQVFFIRHNGGSVWVDELGWPWPKHDCFNDTVSGDK